MGFSSVRPFYSFIHLVHYITVVCSLNFGEVLWTEFRPKLSDKENLVINHDLHSNRLVWNNIFSTHFLLFLYFLRDLTVLCDGLFL